MRLTLVTLVLAALLAVPRVASAVAWTLEAITYTPPEGFVPETGGPADRATWVRRDGDKYCEITVFWSHETGATDAANDQAQTWARMIDANFKTGPASGAPLRSQLPSGIELLGNIAMAQTPQGPRVVMLFTAHALGRSTPILVVASTPDAIQFYQGALDAFSLSLVMNKPYVRPANLPSQPLRVSVADLAGDWQQGGANVITYVNGSGGITGQNTSFYNLVYHIAADGTYRSSMAGMTGGATVSEHITGQMQLDGEVLVITQSGHSTRRLRLALYYDGPNGTVLGLVPEDRLVSLGTITANGEFWVRKR